MHGVLSAMEILVACGKSTTISKFKLINNRVALKLKRYVVLTPLIIARR